MNKQIYKLGIYVSMVFIPIEVEAEDIEEAHIQAEEIARAKLDSLADGDYLEYKFEIDEVVTSFPEQAEHLAWIDRAFKKQ